MNLVLLGLPGSGKGTQGVFLKEEHGFHLMGMGDLLRSEVRKGTSLGVQIKGLIEAGKLLSDVLVHQMLEQELLKFLSKRIVFDGIPRSVPQAQFLDTMLNRFGLRVDAVLNLCLQSDEVFSRLSSRINCTVCGTAYREQEKVAPLCLSCGGKDFERRADDHENVIKERLRLHKEKEKPLLDYYASKGVLQSIDASKGPWQVHGDVMACVQQIQC